MTGKLSLTMLYGNPTSYNGNTYTWQSGRELAKIVNGSNTYQYTYNDAGVRTSKTVNGTTTKFYLDGSDVIYEVTGNDVFYFQYDSDGGLIGFKYNGTQYYYIKNGTNDIIGILDSNLNQIVKYTYSSWGALISVTDNAGNTITDTNNIGIKNPYRYREYRYENETGLYYLQSRFYDPNWGRFLSPDSILGANEDMLGYNLYAYVSNNPVNYSDEDGNGKIWNGVKSVSSWAWQGIKGAVKDDFSNMAKSAQNIYGWIVNINEQSRTSWAKSMTDLENAGGRRYTTAEAYNKAYQRNYNSYDFYMGVCSMGMNNLRVLPQTLIKGYQLSMDLERGGSGLVNIHLKIDGVKYFFKNGKFFNNFGKEIPNILRDNATIKKALNKALDMIKKGW